MCLYYSDSAVAIGADIHGKSVSVKDVDSPQENRLFSTKNSSAHLGRTQSKPKRFIYVGVMTAKKYLTSRARAAYETWAASIPGKVEFFSSAGSGTVHAPAPLPVVSLAGVDDSYPPQKKSFMMLKYIHDHYLDKFEWFMRADDDVYIRGAYFGSEFDASAVCLFVTEKWNMLCIMQYCVALVKTTSLLNY